MYKEERAKKIIELRKEGLSMPKIGEKFGMSKQRVSQILIQHGIKHSNIYVQIRKKMRFVKHLHVIKDMHYKHSTANEIAKRTGLKMWEVIFVIKENKYAREDLSGLVKRIKIYISEHSLCQRWLARQIGITGQLLNDLLHRPNRVCYVPIYSLIDYIERNPSPPRVTDQRSLRNIQNGNSIATKDMAERAIVMFDGGESINSIAKKLNIGSMSLSYHMKKLTMTNGEHRNLSSMRKIRLLIPGTDRYDLLIELVNKGESQSDIAIALGVSPTTICREMQRSNLKKGAN